MSYQNFWFDHQNFGSGQSMFAGSYSFEDMMVSSCLTHQYLILLNLFYFSGFVMNYLSCNMLQDYSLRISNFFGLVSFLTLGCFFFDEAVFVIFVRVSDIVQ